MSSRGDPVALSLRRTPSLALRLALGFALAFGSTVLLLLLAILLVVTVALLLQVVSKAADGTDVNCVLLLLK